MSDDKLEHILGKVQVSRRDAVRKLLIGAFAAPLVMSFTMKGIPVQAALCGNAVCS